MPIASRLTNTGTLLVNGSFDENTSIAPSKFRTTSNTVYAGTLDEFTGAPVVDSSLKLWLDAGQPASYPGTGTTWTDLSGGGNNGTLNNGVGFDSSNGGGLVFDGSNDYVDLNTNNIITGTNPFTFSCFYTITTVNGGGEIFGNYGVGYTTNYLWISGEYGAYLDGAVYFPGAPISAGTYHMAVTRDSGGSVILYKNGAQVNSGTLASSIAVGPNFRLGADVTGSATVGGERLNGKIYNQMVYNRALTAAEIVQNYNALQSRYGLASITATQMPVVQRQQSSGTLLVNGEFDEFTGAPVVDSSLQLWLDAGQPASYPGSGSTWTDLSGNSRTGTLTNGPTYSATNGGSIVFDGTNDYVQCSGSLTLTAATFVTWIRRNGTQTNYAGILFSRGTNVTGLNIFPTDKLGYHWGSTYFDFDSNLTIPDLTWCMVALSVTSTGATLYLCQSSGITTATNVAIHNSTVFDNIQLAQDDTVPGFGIYRFFKGNISAAQLYNRALTADEITTNFNALRNRYGI